jgi:endonuclease III
MDEYLAQQSFDDLVGVSVTARFDPSYRASPSLVPSLVTVAPRCGRFAGVPLAGVSSGEGSFGGRITSRWSRRANRFVRSCHRGARLSASVRRSMRTQNKDAVPKRSLTIGAVVNVLGEHYGPPLSLPTADPFELILWENVAYLAPPARRRQAFEQLKRTVGTAPEVILTAKQSALERVTARGILKTTFAAKLRECASIAVNEFGGDLGAVIRGPLDSAKRALRLFPGIGEPGAEKILLFTGQQALLAPDSNGLRVLLRLGLVREEKKSYSRTYAASRQVANDLPKEPSVMQEAHLLLQQHGQSLCKRGVPRCEQCPLTLVCAYARMTHGAPNKHLQPSAAGARMSRRG